MSNGSTENFKKAPTTADCQEAARLQHEILQEKLNSHCPNGDVLDRTALRLVQGLDAKQTKLAQHEGKFTDSALLVDFKERKNYAKVIIDVFGAEPPRKVALTDPRGAKAVPATTVIIDPRQFEAVPE